MSSTRRILPDAGQESVWDYPRPPRLEKTRRRLRIEFAGRIIVDTTSAWRVLETSHPPVYYIDREAIDPDVLRAGSGSSFCEYKGRAIYYDLVLGERVSLKAAWSYPVPARGFESIAHHLAFYATRVDACYVDEERVTPQAGDFYGGWVTHDVVGPFKGAPGTSGW